MGHDVSKPVDTTVQKLRAFACVYEALLRAGRQPMEVDIEEHYKVSDAPSMMFSLPPVTPDDFPLHNVVMVDVMSADDAVAGEGVRLEIELHFVDTVPVDIEAIEVVIPDETIRNNTLKHTLKHVYEYVEIEQVGTIMETFLRSLNTLCEQQQWRGKVGQDRSSRAR